MRWVGTRYAWGGGSLSGPSEGWGIDAGVVGFDCSGLTRYAYYQAGISIPRNSTAQYAGCPRSPVADLQRGDLVFYAFDTSDPSTIHHVALYLGGGQMIEAPESGMTVRVTAMRWSGYIGRGPAQRLTTPPGPRPRTSWWTCGAAVVCGCVPPGGVVGQRTLALRRHGDACTV